MKPREFDLRWVEDGPLEPYWRVGTLNEFNKHREPAIHVIEYSAYELWKKRAELKGEQCVDLMDHNEKLTEQNKIMRETLDRLCSGEFRDNNVDGIANEALQKCGDNEK